MFALKCVFCDLRALVRKLVSPFGHSTQVSAICDYLIINTEKKAVYTNSFPDAQTSKRVQNHEISIYFFNKLDSSFVSRTSITRKFKMLWFPNEAHY